MKRKFVVPIVGVAVVLVGLGAASSLPQPAGPANGKCVGVAVVDHGGSLVMVRAWEDGSVQMCHHTVGGQWLDVPPK